MAYAINERIGGAGIGTPAYYACAASEKQGWLRQALALGYQRIGKGDFADRVEVAVPFGKACSNLTFGIRKLWPAFPAYTLRDNLFDLLAARKLKPCDIFHGWNQHCLATMRKAKGFGALTVVERGSTHPDYQNRILGAEYRKYGLAFRPVEPAMHQKSKKELAEADYVFVNSEFSRRTCIAAGIPAQKLKCVFRGVDVERFTKAKHPQQEKFTVLFAGLIGLRKGIQYLLEAWEQLQLSDAELVLVGNVVPDGAAILRKYAGNPTIRCRGFVSDMAAEYRHASILALPTLEEGSAKVTFEAMAAGLPVITTPNAGSAVRQGKEGFLIPIRDVRALKQRIRYFYDNRAELGRFGRRARQRAAQFTWERYQREFLRTYREIAER